MPGFCPQLRAARDDVGPSRSLAGLARRLERLESLATIIGRRPATRFFEQFTPGVSALDLQGLLGRRLDALGGARLFAALRALRRALLAVAFFSHHSLRSVRKTCASQLGSCCQSSRAGPLNFFLCKASL